MTTRPAMDSPRTGRLGRRLAVVILSLATVNGARAADDSFGMWTVFNTTDTFRTEDGPSRWLYWFDAQARYFDIGSGSNQYLVRPAIGYALNDQWSVWLGYARFRTRGPSGDVANENRYWQQLLWSGTEFAGGTISVRGRLLERFSDAGDDTGLLIRVLTKYVRPIDEKKSFIVGIEPFFNVRDADWTGDAGIAQNRTFLGMGINHSDMLAFETGYMNQYLWRDAAQNLSNHLLVVNVKASF